MILEAGTLEFFVVVAPLVARIRVCTDGASDSEARSFCVRNTEPWVAAWVDCRRDESWLRNCSVG